MSVRVSITDNTAKIFFEDTQNAALAIRYMLDAIDFTANPRTPKREGNLRKDILKTVVGTKGSIKWQKNYAYFQEAKQHGRYTTPGTGPHYAENAVRQVVDHADVYFKKARLI